MPEYSNIALLTEAIRGRAMSPPHLVGIDGHSGAGKTRLGQDLAKVAKAPLLSTDTYALEVQDADEYPDRLDLHRLAGDVAAVSGAQPLVFVEGICLRHVLRRIGMWPQTFVYCKRVSAVGLWPDDPANTFQMDGRTKPGLSWTDRQSALYHRATCPLESADLIFVYREA
jgi:hypothetical protein